MSDRIFISLGKVASDVKEMIVNVQHIQRIDRYDDTYLIDLGTMSIFVEKEVGDRVVALLKEEGLL